MGTSLLDFDTTDPTVLLLRALSSPDKAIRDAARRALTGASRLPASVTTAPATQIPHGATGAWGEGPVAHMLPASVSSAPRPVPMLPAMHSTAPPMAADPRALPPMPDPGSMPVSLLADNSQPKGAIGQMLQGMLAAAPGPQGPPSAPPMQQPPQSMGGAPGPAAMLGLAPAGPTSGLLAANGPPPLPSPSMGDGPSPLFALPAAPKNEPKPSMVDRIHDWLQNRIAPELPPGYEGLLTTDEARRARPGIAESLFGLPGGPSARDQYRAHLNDTLVGHQAILQIAEQQRIANVRRDIRTRFPIRPGMSQSELNDAFEGIYAHALANGDFEMAKNAKDIAEKIATMQPEKPMEISGVLGDPTGPNAGKTVKQLFDYRTGKMVRELPEGAAPVGFHSPEKIEHVAVNGKPFTIMRDPVTGRVVDSYPEAAPLKTPGEVTASQKLDNDQVNKILDDFRQSKDVSDYQAARSGIDLIRSAKQNPNSIAGPFAVLDGYARVANPGAAVRVGTMQVLREMGSANQKIARWIDQATKGTWPPDMLSDISHLAETAFGEKEERYKDQIEMANRRARRAGIADVTPLLTDPTSPNTGSATPTPARKTGPTVGDLRRKR